MRILHVVPSFYPAFYHGGPIYSLYHLCNALVKSGIELKVLTTDMCGRDHLQIREFPLYAPLGYPIYFFRRRFFVSVAPGLLGYLLKMVRWADVVHLTAVYSFPTIPTLLMCRLLSKPIVWSPRGSLERWDGSRRLLVKRIWEWICRHVMPQRTFLHVTSEEEAKASETCFKKIPTRIVPNGVDIPAEVKHTNGNGTLRLLYLSRLDPKKGLENLLQACQLLNQNKPLKWTLKIAGFGEPSYVRKIEALLKESNFGNQVEMVGKVEGDEKEKWFQDTDVFIFPSHTENFGVVVAESLAHGIPVIVSRGTPWKRVEEKDCGLWVENHPESLAQAIEKISKMPLRQMGSRGRQWMQEEFSWDQQAKKMSHVYFEINKNGN
ncbi:MAG: glycosyltransferase [Chlamydiae bacterium]|nr:glycosyltransferase [Chlamydiota bacterium]MBI3276198.1 glycosyltransferase [Chlamydiota bacterium]